jgi:predicted nucleotidyltransferase
MNICVNYSLNETLKLEIIKIRDEILMKLKNPEIYLFGSIAKGGYSEKSDIDLLVLINYSKAPKELRLLRHEIEDNLEKLKIERTADIKLYDKDRYEELCKNPSFEKAILEDLIDIGGWESGK